MSDKVENLRIENFKAFTDVRIEPGRLNIITGRNNTGKSSILESINIANNPENVGFFSRFGIRDLINLESEEAKLSLNEDFVILRPPEDYEEISDAVGRKFIRDYKRKIENFDVGDPDNVTEEDVSAIVQRSDELSEKVMQKSTIVERKNEKDVFFDSIEVKTRREILTAIIENLHPEKAEEILEEIDRLVYPGRLHRGDNDILDEYRIGGNRLEHDDTVIQEKIEKFVERHDLIDNFSGFRDGEIVLENDDGELSSLPLAYMGDGFRAIIGLVRKIIISDYDTVLVEEPENHLHPGYVSELADFIVEQTTEEDVQFFITTHNADFIEEFFKERFKQNSDLRENFSLFRLQRRGFVESMDYEESRKELEELKMDLRGNK